MGERVPKITTDHDGKIVDVVLTAEDWDAVDSLRRTFLCWPGDSLFLAAARELSSGELVPAADRRRYEAARALSRAPSPDYTRTPSVDECEGQWAAIHIAAAILRAGKEHTA